MPTQHQRPLSKILLSLMSQTLDMNLIPVIATALFVRTQAGRLASTLELIILDAFVPRHNNTPQKIFTT